MLRKICVSMTQISHSELTGEHPFRYGKKCISALRNLDLHKVGGFLVIFFFIFLVLIAKEKSTQSKSDF